jgi:hypothetical protein
MASMACCEGTQHDTNPSYEVSGNMYIYTYVQYIGKCIKGTCIGNILYSSLYMENVLIAI